MNRTPEIKSSPSQIEYIAHAILKIVALSQNCFMKKQDYIKHLQKVKNSDKFDRFIAQIDTAGDCPVRITNTVLGGKWKPVVLNLVLNDVKRFGEMIHLTTGLSKKVLTHQLRELEHDGILIRTASTKKPLKVEYDFSELGKTCIPLLHIMCDWALKKN